MSSILAAILIVVAIPMSTTAVAQELPSIPEPVPVAVDRATTALLVLDIITPICPPRPACVEALPTIRALLNRAREAGLFVVHSDVSVFAPNSAPLPEVAPLPGEPTVASLVNKFANTNLDDLLRQRGITTLIMVGLSANGAVMYTAYDANALGYTVVVAEDAIPAEEPFGIFLARYQLLHQPGLDNPQNEPLRERAVTLSRSDLITIR
jgi:hypothetical protein